MIIGAMCVVFPNDKDAASGGWEMYHVDYNGSALKFKMDEYDSTRNVGTASILLMNTDKLWILNGGS